MGKPNLAHIGGYAATGAALGSAVPGIGTAAGAIGGGLYGLFSDLLSSEDEDVANANAAKIAALQKAGVDIQAYRPELMKMEEAGKQEQLSQFGGTRSLLAAMQGQGQGGPDGNAGYGRAQANPQMGKPVMPMNLGKGQVPQDRGAQMPITPLNLRRS